MSQSNEPAEMSQSNSRSNAWTIGIAFGLLLLAIVFAIGLLRITVFPPPEVAQSDPQSSAAKGDGEQDSSDALANDPDQNTKGVGGPKPDANDDAEPDDGAPIVAAPEQEDVAGPDDDANAPPKKTEQKRAQRNAVWETQLAAEPQPWRERALPLFNVRSELPAVETLQEWFEAAPGTPAPAFRLVNTNLGRCAMFKGVAKLRAPIREPVAYRIQFQTSRLFQAHFFVGEEGVTLARHNDGFWSGYRTQRKGASPIPSRKWIAATDNSAQIRQRGQGPLDICILNDAICLTAGDVQLLRVSLPGLATEVFLEGEASVQGMSLRRITDAPTRPAIERKWATYPPNHWEWESKLDEASKLTVADDAVEMSANPKSAPDYAWFKLPELGLRYVELDLENASPGAAIYMGQGGEARFYVRFLQNSRDGQLCAVLRGDQATKQDLGRFRDRRITSTSPKVTVRMLASCGIVRAWLSLDGENWASLGYAGQPWPTLDSVGISHAPRAKSTLRVTGIRTASAEGIVNLANPKLLAKATPSPSPNIADWWVHCLYTLPEGADLDEWRRASAVRSLQHWTDGNFMSQLLTDLLADAKRPANGKARLAALKEAATVNNFTRDSAALQQFADELEKASGANAHRALGEWLRSIYALPITTQHRAELPTDRWLERSARNLIYQRDWPALSQLSNQARIHSWERRFTLLPWVDSLVERNADEATRLPGANVSRNRWPAPIIEELDRETFNLTAELNTALESGNYELAADIATGIRDSSQTGLAPAADDPALLISLSAALNGLTSRHPEVAAMIAEKHADVARLRLQQATDDADADAMRTVAEQFAGANAGGAASLWLGDHFLSHGRFREAVEEYRRAALSKRHQTDAESRLRLAAVYAPAASPEAANPKGDVAFATTRYSSEEFDKLIQKLDSIRQSEGRDATIPSASKLKLDFVAKLDGQVGKSPNQALVREGAKLAPNWPIRQLAVTPTKDTVFVSNRFQVAAYHASDGKRKWTSEAPPGEPLRSQDWFLTPTRPLVDDTAVYCRILNGPGPLIAKFKRDDGKLLWSTSLEPSTFVVSDPWLVESSLRALVVSRGQQNSQLYLADFETDTGKMQLGTKLFELRDSWWRMRYCAVTQTSNGFVVATAGGVAHCSQEGALRWLRRHESAPTDLSPRWCTQSFRAPIVVNQTVYHLSPGNQIVETVDLASGRLNWSRLEENSLGILQVGGGRLCLYNSHALKCLNAEDGSVLWRTHLPDVEHAFVSDEKTAIVAHYRSKYLRRSPRNEPELVWVDLKTGQIKHAEPLPGLQHQRPFIGPLVPQPKALYLFYSNGRDDVDLDYLKLSVETKAAPWRPMTVTPWTWHVDPELQRSIFNRFPGWTLCAGESDVKWGITRQLRGATDVLTYQLNPKTSVIWSTKEDLSSAKKFRLGVWADAKIEAKLAVFADNRLIHEQAIEPSAPSREWATFEMDLPKQSQPTDRLSVQLSLPKGPYTKVHIRQLELE